MRTEAESSSLDEGRMPVAQGSGAAQGQLPPNANERHDLAVSGEKVNLPRRMARFMMRHKAAILGFSVALTVATGIVARLEGGLESAKFVSQFVIFALAFGAFSVAAFYMIFVLPYAITSTLLRLCGRCASRFLAARKVNSAGSDQPATVAPLEMPPMARLNSPQGEPEPQNRQVEEPVAVQIPSELPLSAPATPPLRESEPERPRVEAPLALGVMEETQLESEPVAPLSRKQEIKREWEQAEPPQESYIDVIEPVKKTILPQWKPAKRQDHDQAPMKPVSNVLPWQPRTKQAHEAVTAEKVTRGEPSELPQDIRAKRDEIIGRLQSKWNLMLPSEALGRASGSLGKS